jgi:hypothetical protein
MVDFTAFSEKSGEEAAFKLMRGLSQAWTTPSASRT